MSGPRAAHVLLSAAAIALACGLVAADEAQRRPARSAFAHSLPIVFDSEQIALNILGDSLEVRGRYLLRCQGRGEGEIPLLYPFPRDSLLGGWRFVSLAVRAGAAALPAPARWEALPGQWAVRWWLPPCASDTLIAEAVYRQALRGEYARYIVTTTRAWERPLRRAEFEIRLPAGAEPVEFSFPFAPAVEAPGLYRYEAMDFLPDHDIVVRWRPAAMEIPFTLAHDKVILPVTVGDSRPLRIILDTGMTWDGLLITNPALRDSLALAGAVEAQLGGAGGSGAQRALMLESAEFRVGELACTGQRLVVLAGDAMRGFANDGVCGQTLFGHYAVELDYARSVLRLHPPGSFAADSGWTALPLRFTEHGVPALDIGVSIGGGDSLALAAYIDLAASETLELLTGESQRFALPPAREPAYLGRGLGGDIHGERGEIAWVALGPLRVTRPLATFVPAAQRSRQAGAEAVVGGALLARFHCVLDYSGARLYLKPLD